MDSVLIETLQGLVWILVSFVLIFIRKLIVCMCVSILKQCCKSRVGKAANICFQMQGQEFPML